MIASNPMASLQKLPSKRKTQRGRGRQPMHLWRIQFLHAGKRRTLRLGRWSIRDAEDIREHIEHLVQCFEYRQSPRSSTQEWLRDSPLTVKLYKIGLCRRQNNPTLYQWIDHYMDKRECKPRTRTNLNLAYGSLKRHFGPHVKLRAVTLEDAIGYWEWLKGTVKSENTARRRFGRVRELFAYAVEQQVISHNPFKQRALPVSVGAASKQYISAATVQQIIDYIPKDRTEWRLTLALGRFAGVRMPSELAGFRWDHVNWELGKILIHAPKTEKQGKPARWVPIFAGLEPHLSAHWDRHGDSELVLPQLPSNPGTTAKKFTASAGIVPWSNYWNSLRASCETDLMDAYGVRRACQWIGNSAAVAMKNYSLLKHEDFVDGKSSGDEWLQQTRPASVAKT